MKNLLLLMLIVVVPAYAGEECVFDEAAYTSFIREYAGQHSTARVEPDGKTLVVKKDGEEITVTGGGCVHLGVAIELRSSQSFTEAQFLQRILVLSIEFGDWLINTHALEESITNHKYQVINGEYFFDVNSMTVLTASYKNPGKLSVDFYIN